MNDVITDKYKAEFLYKVKPKLPNQFKAAEQNGVPFALILGEVGLILTEWLWAGGLTIVLRTSSLRARSASRRWVSRQTTLSRRAS